MVVEAEVPRVEGEVGHLAVVGVLHEVVVEGAVSVVTEGGEGADRSAGALEVAGEDSLVVGAVVEEGAGGEGAEDSGPGCDVCYGSVPTSTRSFPAQSLCRPDLIIMQQPANPCILKGCYGKNVLVSCQNVFRSISM